MDRIIQNLGGAIYFFQVFRVAAIDQLGER